MVSMDGDPPAAMRYTEARLSEIAATFFKILIKTPFLGLGTLMIQRRKSTVLPAAFPNLLVNGATGISAGYATRYPTT